MRLTDKQKRFVCDHLARYTGRAKLIDLCLDQFDWVATRESRQQIARKIDYFQCHSNARSWRDYIAAARARWVADLSAVPLAQNRLRVQELGMLYASTVKRLNASTEESAAEKMTGTALKILKQIRDEVDADRPNPVTPGNTDSERSTPTTGFEALTDRELINAAERAGVQMNDNFAHTLVEND